MNFSKEYDCLNLGFCFYFMTGVMVLILSSLPAPNEAEISIRKVEEGIAAVSKFSGKPEEDVVRAKENTLRQNLVSDGLRAKEGCLLARYNDPGRTWSFTMVRLL